MKKLMMISLAATSLMACNDQKKTDEVVTTNMDTTVTTNSAMSADTSKMAPVTATTTTATYLPAEGDVMYKSGKVMVYRNGAYVKADKDVELESGVVVRPNGEVVRNDEYITLEDGEMVSRSGSFWDKTGNTIGDGWRGAKKGVKKAGEAIKKAGQKTGEAVKSVVN